MGKDISNIQCELIGISCMDDSHAREQIRREWDSRFQVHHTFWVDAPNKPKPNELIKTIAEAVSSRGIFSLAGKTVILTVFLDLTQCPNAELLKEIAEIPDKLNTMLGCNVPLMLTFGNLKEMAFLDKNQLRQHAAQVVQVHKDSSTTRKQLVLIAKSPLVKEEKDDKSWKAAVTLLDILRRVADPAGVIPIAGAGIANDDVGFIRYGEYVGEEVDRLKNKASALNYALGNSGATKLRDALQQELSTMGNKVAKDWEVSAKLQPVHPDMAVDGWMAKNKAKKGKNKEFEAARHATVMALEATGRHMKDAILSAFKPMADKAEEYLDTYIQSAGVGLALEEDRVQMKNALNIVLTPCTMPSLPFLSYSEAGYDNEIFAYLQSIQEYAGYEARRKFAQSILTAYESRPQEYYDKKRKEIQDQLDKIHLELGRYIERDALIHQSASGHPLPQTSFFPVLGGGDQRRLVLCREKADDADVSAACNGSQTSVYYIDKAAGGINRLDNAPIKSLQLLLFDCEKHLEDLIK